MPFRRTKGIVTDSDLSDPKKEADQFFHETRFEVYRALGEHIGLGVLEHLARVEDDACKEVQQAWQAAEHA